MIFQKTAVFPWVAKNFKMLLAFLFVAKIFLVIVVELLIKLC